jgi:hypothetical protein
MLGTSRQTVLQRVKRGEPEAMHVTRGQQKGVRIKATDRQPNLFDPAPRTRRHYDVRSKDQPRSSFGDSNDD